MVLHLPTPSSFWQRTGCAQLCLDSPCTSWCSESPARMHVESLAPVFWVQQIKKKQAFLNAPGHFSNSPQFTRSVGSLMFSKSCLSCPRWYRQTRYCTTFSFTCVIRTAPSILSSTRGFAAISGKYLASFSRDPAVNSVIGFLGWRRGGLKTVLPEVRTRLYKPLKPHLRIQVSKTYDNKFLCEFQSRRKLCRSICFLGSRICREPLSICYLRVKDVSMLLDCYDNVLQGHISRETSPRKLYR